MTIGNSHLLIEPHQVISTRWVMGVTRTKSVSLSDVEKIVVDRGVQIGATIYHVVRLETKSGSRITLGTGIRDRNEAEWVAAEIEKVVRR